EMERFTAPPSLLSRGELAKLYSGSMEKMLAIEDWAKANRVPVLLATIPSKAGAIEYSALKGRGRNQFQRELESLAALYEHDYFDGYAVFLGESAKSIASELWFEEDGHWNAKGSDRFAERLAAFIRTKWAAKMHVGI